MPANEERGIMLSIATIDRYFQTLRHLRAIQIWGRVRFRLIKPRPDISPVPSLRSIKKKWQSPSQCEPSLVASRRFNFLNKIEDIDVIGWDNPNIDMLWRYNQHYFDDLNAKDAHKRHQWHLSLMSDWVEHNPPGKGSGWDPYPTSLRIVNWIKFSLAGNSLPEPCLQSLAIQARWLMKRLEWHLLGNHLLANAKALLFAGIFFEGKEADSWRKKGLKILMCEIEEQILPDGAHFELSPMYHAIILEDMLDVINLSNVFFGVISPKTVKDWVEMVQNMRYWLLVMSHPDGQIAFFNDAAFGIAAEPSELEAYAKRLKFLPHKPITEVVTHLSASGYIRVQKGEMVAILDVAQIGPDYLPGHAHADSLTFELSLFDQRVIVNSGTSEYGISPERLRQRGTAAHNTVEVDGKNSSEVWGGFRVARRAYTHEVKVQDQGDQLIVEAEHDGYRTLSGKPIHKRKWIFSPSSLNIIDIITSDRYSAQAYFHLHPEAKPEQISENSGKITLLTNNNIYWSSKGGSVQTKPSFWHPQFGISTPSTCLTLPLYNSHASFDLSWT